MKSARHTGSGRGVYAASMHPLNGALRLLCRAIPERSLKRRKRRAPTAGFSLVEVMVAILILGVALVGLTQGISTALASGKESELQTTAALFAAGQIEELRATGDITDGTSDGDCGEALPLYRWKQTITATDLDGLHDVSVVIEHARTGEPLYQLRTLLFQLPDNSSSNTKQSQGKGAAR